MFDCFWLSVSVQLTAWFPLERLVCEMTYYVSSGTLNPTPSLTVLTAAWQLDISTDKCCVLTSVVKVKLLINYILVTLYFRCLFVPVVLFYCPASGLCFAK